METLLMSREEIARRARECYDKHIRSQVETPENIGRMVVIDIETGEFGVDDLGFDAATQLRIKNPHARLFGLRIGYKVAVIL